VFRITPFTAPARREPLRTDGLYAVVRHPLMVCDILWPLGLSLIFGSMIGIALTPVWLLMVWVLTQMMVWVLTQVEEEALVREYGDAYRDFQERVPRLFPACAPPTADNRPEQSRASGPRTAILPATSGRSLSLHPAGQEERTWLLASRPGKAGQRPMRCTSRSRGVAPSGSGRVGAATQPVAYRAPLWALGAYCP
jgi:Phospholipid methyltransferase